MMTLTCAAVCALVALSYGDVGMTSSATVAPSAVEADDEPALPAGLDDPDEHEPGLPAGLGDAGDDEPGLPAGMDDDEPPPPSGLEDTVDAEPSDDSGAESPIVWHGFIELRSGARVVDFPESPPVSIGEARLQISGEYTWSFGATRLVSDFLYDPVSDDYEVDLERGAGFVDLREASLSLTPIDLIDLKVGRQILTWGTGDLLFINDLFPKDWNAFFLGRDTEYLKAPSDAVKVSLFTPLADLDVIYTPRFDADRIPERRRLSTFDPLSGRIAGGETPIVDARPDGWFEDDEWAFRLSRRISALEVALYGYYGNWKSPAGFEPATGAATYPALSVYGASVRGPLLGGIAHVEGGYFDSRDDRDGTDPFVRNGELRLIGGFERELGRNLTGAAQYYLERVSDYDAYVASAPAGAPLADQNHHIVTFRLTWRLLQQTLTASLFGYISPSDVDGYLRPSLSYQVDDAWRLDMGGNVFFGRDPHTFFGQLQDNSNVFVSARYSL